MPKKKYPIELSDWITFLEGSKSLAMSYWVFLGTFAIAFAVTGVRFDITNPASTLTTVIIGGIFFWILYKMRYAISRIKKYQKLAQKIIRGEITDPKKVLEEYNKFAPKFD